MTKLDQKFLQTYNLETLRDTNLSGPNEGDYLVYSGGEWVDTPTPAFGKDFSEKTKVNSETQTGATFAVYDSLVFNVSETTGFNKYRINLDFLWGHNSASNDIIVAAAIDNATILKQIQIEPKDSGTDQRIQNSLLYYANDLAPGNHTIFLGYRPANSSRVSRMYESVIEVWRAV